MHPFVALSVSRVSDRPAAQAIAGQRAGRHAKRLLLAAAALGIVAAAGVYGHDWWTVGRFQVETDDAYVAADSVLVSPKVSGYLAQVLVQDNQTVHAGEVLARIDDRDYRTALDQARADVAAARADIDNLQQEIEQQAMTIAQARTLVAADQAAVAFSEQQLAATPTWRAPAPARYSRRSSTRPTSSRSRRRWRMTRPASAWR